MTTGPQDQEVSGSIDGFHLDNEDQEAKDFLAFLSDDMKLHKLLLESENRDLTDSELDFIWKMIGG